MSEEEEIWRPVYGYTGLYEVSNLGRVKGLKRGKVLKPSSNLSSHQRKHCPNNAKDYYKVKLSKNNIKRDRYIHYLVCRAFHGPRPAKHEAGHKDPDTTNNRADNLFWQNKKANRGHHPEDCLCPWCNKAPEDVTIEDIFGENEVPF